MTRAHAHTPSTHTLTLTRGGVEVKVLQPAVRTIKGMGNMQQVHSTDVDTQMSTPK